jgi:diacylglycerol kinase family enzyme
MKPESHGETRQSPPPSARLCHPDARQVLISVNPKAGARARNSHVRGIEESLSAGGFDVRATADLDQLVEWASEAWKNQALRAVVTVGGDGTASLVRSRVPLEIPLLPLPLGTENLLARYVCQGAGASDVRETLESGVTIELDLGRADGRLFLLMISAGFDAEVIRRLHVERRGNITRRSYVLPTLQTIRSYRYPELQLYCGDAAMPPQDPLRCRSMFAFNLPLYALRLPFAPQAIGTDGLLDLCTFDRGGVWSMARYLWHVARARHHALSDVSALRSNRFRLEAAGAEDVAYQLDGDLGGMLPVEVQVLPRKLRLMVSRSAARQLGFVLPSDEADPVKQSVGTA